MFIRFPAIKTRQGDFGLANEKLSKKGHIPLVQTIKTKILLILYSCFYLIFSIHFSWGKLEDGLHFSSWLGESRLEMSWLFDFCLESELTFWDTPFCARQKRHMVPDGQSQSGTGSPSDQIKEWQVVVQIHKYMSTCANQCTNVTRGFLNITVARVIWLPSYLSLFEKHPHIESFISRCDVFGLQEP